MMSEILGQMETLMAMENEIKVFKPQKNREKRRL
jgi:hypothetical protein